MKGKDIGKLTKMRLNKLRQSRKDCILGNNKN